MNLNSIDLLLVEDNDHDAEMTMRELKTNKLANNVFRVKDGEEALDFIFATGQYADSRSIVNPPRLVLLDIKMPKLNGIEVLQRIKANEQTMMIPVVMLTSSKQDPDINTSYKLGANSYIVKPVSFEGFAQSIKHLGLYWLLLNQPPA